MLLLKALTPNITGSPETHSVGSGTMNGARDREEGESVQVRSPDAAIMVDSGTGSRSHN